MIAEYMRREVAGILGKEWPPRSDEEEEKKVVPTSVLFLPSTSGSPRAYFLGSYIKVIPITS